MGDIMSEEAERYRAKMQKRKAMQDRMVAENDREKGLLIVHTGKGKGKSTAAFGMAVRSAGYGRRVTIIQFIKGAWDTGEQRAFKLFGDQIAFHPMGEGFTWDTQDKARDIAACERAWAQAQRAMSDSEINLVILDELNIALRYKYLSCEKVLAGLAQRPPMQHVVATGRHAPEALIEAADLVTEMTLIKHPFQAGIKAQEGIEY